MNQKDLPFVAEYAKSGRAACKTCKQKIGQGSLRIGVMVQSAHFDGKVPMWHHSRCYFSKKSAIANETEIANFDNLRWEDQEKLKEQIAKGPTGTNSSGGTSGNSDFSIEYAKTGRAVCRGCGEKIPKGEIRISKLIKDGESARYGPTPGWHHVDCFVKNRIELDYSDSANKLPGYNFLEAEDKKLVQGKIGKITIKRKVVEEEEASTETKKLRKDDILLKTQNELLFEMRDKLKKALTKQEMAELLEYNKQYVSPGEQNIRDHLSDCLVFGAVKTCPECKNASPRYKIDAYRCPGNLTEWTKCQYVTRCPEREPFKIPEEFKENYEFLRDYKYVPRKRILPKKVDASSAPKGPLYGYIVSVFGKLSTTKGNVEKMILELSGAVTQKIDSSVNFCISCETEIAKNSKKVISAQNLDIHIVSEKFLESVKNGSKVAVAIQENLICTWGGDPILKFGIKKENDKNQAAASSSSNSYSSSSQSGSKSKTMKVSVQGGAAVDPDSRKEHSCHVYQKKGDIYSVVLGNVDISLGKNSYYKLQLLEENKRKSYHLFRSWGRVGTNIGDNRLEKMPSLEYAIKEFSRLYLEKTGNEWCDRKNFVKKPGCSYPLDIDYGQDIEKSQELKVNSDSKLPKPVQELICLIFDIEAMKRAMVEFEIDLQKMPLGKLSKQQIEKAYSVLSEAQQIIVTGCNAIKILDASNRFYTLIPHDFGLKTPTLLDNEDLIKSKIEMLDSLLEIEFAYNLLQSDSAAKDPVFEHYEKLKTDIEVLQEKSEEYKIIKKYMKNTHAETHGHYDLNLKKVFKINRHGESENYKKFKDLHNKKLLWHGSRLTNFVGILSQGLRIAPPEAPITGYMFGKGIYFADMVSKSANYCYTSKSNSTGLLLLCEVALGDMYERVHAEHLTKSHLTKAGKHSTKGLGGTCPDPKENTFIGDVEVPFGKPVKDVNWVGLLYNEYIVYDVSQVNIKYLLEVDFKWKY